MNKEIYRLATLNNYCAAVITKESNVQVWNTIHDTYADFVSTGNPKFLEDVKYLKENSGLNAKIITRNTWEELESILEGIAIEANDQMKAIPLKLYLAVYGNI